MSTATCFIAGPAGRIACEIRGPADGRAVVMTHSILSSRMMWETQAVLLALRGFRVITVDTRGHGESAAPPAPYSMDDLGADTLAVLDGLGIARAHYVGLSLGGMSGYGLGIHHGDRLLSLVLCASRADAPPPVAAPWDERIEIARAQGCSALAASTLERWFGKPFLHANPAVRERFTAAASATSAEGFTGCARAIQGLAYRSEVGAITIPTTLIVGANDGVLPAANAEMQAAIPGALLETIAGAGHLPNIDRPEDFDVALLRHFDRIGPDPARNRGIP